MSWRATPFWSRNLGLRIYLDVRLPGKGISNGCGGARPVHLIITMIKWIRTSRLSIKNCLSRVEEDIGRPLLTRNPSTALAGDTFCGLGTINLRANGVRAQMKFILRPRLSWRATPCWGRDRLRALRDRLRALRAGFRDRLRTLRAGFRVEEALAKWSEGSN